LSQAPSGPPASAQPPATQAPSSQAPPAQPPARTTPDFKLSASPDSLTVRRGATGKITVKVEPVGGFNGRVDLLSSLLYATTTDFSPRAIENGSGASVLTVAPTRSAIKGTYTVSITGTNLAMGHSITVMVTVK
jgi:hypothetical protein